MAADTWLSAKGQEGGEVAGERKMSTQTKVEPGPIFWSINFC